VIFI